MDSQLLIELLAVLVLVLANGLFALAEFSIIASRISRLAQKKAERKFGASAAEKLRSQPERFLASIQVGITLVGVMLGVFSGATIVKKLEVLLEQSPVSFVAESATTISMAVVVIAITILSVVVGELVPKYIALSFPERYARYSSGPATFFIHATSPFSRLLGFMANLIIRLLGVRRQPENGHVTEDEINQMIVEGQRRGVFDLTEQEFIRSVFDFSDSTVRRAIKPRPDIVAFELSDPLKKIMKTIVENGYSRYPIYDGTIDNVVGVIYTKDLIGTTMSIDNIDLPRLIRKPLFVPDSLPLPKLLREFQKGKNHLAIVLDEFGGTAGIITLEDILEELVGEIQDEYDAEAAPILKSSDTVVYANGDVWPGDINELLDSRLPEDSYDTLSGLFTETIGRLPEKSESIQIGDVRLTIIAKDENRILRMKLEKTGPEAADNQ